MKTVYLIGLSSELNEINTCAALSPRAGTEKGSGNTYAQAFCVVGWNDRFHLHSWHLLAFLSSNERNTNSPTTVKFCQERGWEREMLTGQPAGSLCPRGKFVWGWGGVEECLTHWVALMLRASPAVTCPRWCSARSPPGQILPRHPWFRARSLLTAASESVWPGDRLFTQSRLFLSAYHMQGTGLVLGSRLQT